MLRRLTKEGYFQTYLKESTEGPPRKYYQLTEQGETQFHLLVTEWRDFAKGYKKLLKGWNGMSKEGFLKELSSYLRKLPEEERQDILLDYEEHFQFGLEEGKLNQK